MHLRAGTDAGLSTEVVDLVFQGPLIRFELRTADGTTLVAHVGPDEDLPLLRPGDRVQVTWEPDGGRLLRRQERVSVAAAADSV